MFLAKYMPRLDTHLHYRNVDVSSIKELARRWFPRIYFNAPEKNGGHRALADILESIRELDYYRAAAFVAPPGPDHRRHPGARLGRGGKMGSADGLESMSCLIGRRLSAGAMVGIAQLVERLVVVQEVAGSSPVTHPKQRARSPRDRALFRARHRVRED